MNLSFNDADSFISMNSAIKKAVAEKIDVKTKLGKEIATTLDQLQRDFYTEFYSIFSEELKKIFTELRTVLQ